MFKYIEAVSGSRILSDQVCILPDVLPVASFAMLSTLIFKLFKK
jgi:hypothetical protein